MLPVRVVKIASTCTFRQGSGARTECVGKLEWLASSYGPTGSPTRNACIISIGRYDLLFTRWYVSGVDVVRLKCCKQELYWSRIITVWSREDYGDFQVLQQTQGIIALVVTI